MAPAEVVFGGTTIILNGPAQQRLQVEIVTLRADPVALRNTIEQLQYIETVLGPMLEERLLPADLRYLCLPTRQSGGGYWGLDAPNASALGLRQDASVDERLNVAATATAVLDELTALHSRQPNWVRVVLAYANGHRPANTAGQAPDAALPNEPVQLPIDTPSLVWVALARKLVFEREPPRGRPNDPLLLFSYRQGQNKTLAAIARELGLDQSRFVPFNDWLKSRTIPADKIYPVLIRLTASEYLTVRRQVNADAQNTTTNPPHDSGFPVLRKLPTPANRDPLTRMGANFYEINDLKGIQAQPCDNPITLAYYGELSVKEFLAINDMTDRDLVRPGELYYLEKKAKRAKIPFHVVQAGQTLREISTIYGVRADALLTYNRLPPNQRLQPGRILWLREKRPANLPPEYQLAPPPAVPDQPTVAQRKLTREAEESVIDSPAPPSWLPRPPDTLATTARPAAPTPDEPTASEAAPGLVFHTVREGDTHSGVAQRYNLPLADLMTWNSLSYRKPLVAGQRLVVAKPTPPVAPTRPTPPAVALADGRNGVPKPAPVRQQTRENSETVVDVDRPPAPPRASPVATAKPERLVNQVRVETPKLNGKAFYHVVQRGQTVYRVALINNVTVAALMRWNNLSSYTIEIGQRLLIRK